MTAVRDPGFRPIAWALLSLAGWVVAFAMAFSIVAVAGTIGVLGADTAGLRLDLAVVLALHGALAFGAVQLAGWLALGTFLRPTATRAAVPAVGVALAALVELALHAWAETRYGYYDLELVGPTAVLSLALVASATASFGVAVAPRDAVGPPFAALLVAAAGVTAIAAMNLPGLRDAIGHEGRALAVLVALSVAYVLGTLGLGVRRLRSN